MQIVSDCIDFNAYADQATSFAGQVQRVGDYRERYERYALNPPTRRGIGCCWRNHTELLRFRPAELSVWGGVNGHGKSTLLSYVMMSLIQKRQRIMIASMEMSVEQTIDKLIRQSTGQAAPDKSLRDRFFSWTEAYCWILDHVGAIPTKSAFGLAQYAASINIQHLVIDSMVKCSIRPDDYNAQHAFISRLQSVAKSEGLHVHVVCHSRKRDTEHRVMDKFDIKGAGEISDLADNVFTVWRNKKKESDCEAVRDGLISDPDCRLVCDKQRNGSWEGNIPLWFDLHSLQYHSSSGEAAVCYLDHARPELKDTESFTGLSPAHTPSLA